MNDGLNELRERLRDKKALITIAIGELGWLLQRQQGHLRFLKNNEYKDYDIIIVTYANWHPFVADFCTYTVTPPEWFCELNLEGDGYEAVPPNSPPGSMTPPDVYQHLILFMRDICKYTKNYEILLPPRGCNTIIENRPQLFARFTSAEPIFSENPIVVVFPRGRVRATFRNVPEFVWAGLVQELSKQFTVVLAGTPSGACLVNAQGTNIINLISYEEEDKTDKIIQYLNSAVCSISSQSGGTHISLLSGCPSYIIGHEKERHTQHENRLDMPTSFRFVQDYRAIDVGTILNDVQGFLNALEEVGWFSKLNRPSLRTLKDEKELVGVEIGVDGGLNSLNILENLDIKKLYLIDPYALYRDLKNIGCNTNEEECIRLEKEARERLKDYEDKIVWIKDLSENVVDQVPDDLDFVYVDGNHRYDYVKKDIELYYPKLKAGGLLTCHDYDYPEVKKAFDEFFAGQEVEYNRCADNQDRFEAWAIKLGDFNSILVQDYDKLLELIK